MEEKEHLIQVLEQAKRAIQERDSLKLKELSNYTIHSASIKQDHASVTIALIIYTISKLMERKSSFEIKNWDTLIKKIIGQFDLAIRSLKQNNETQYQKYLEMTKKTILTTTPTTRKYIEEVLRKASINKASRIYEHGISLGRTAEVLGVSKWELGEYTGQSKASDVKYSKTIDVKTRAKMAVEFFS